MERPGRPGIRAALRALGADKLSIRYLYLDASGIPPRYKVRRVAGEPVPMSVLAEMERNPVDPWNVRDRMLNEMAWAMYGEQRRKHD